MTSVEIEKKFLLKAMPDKDPVEIIKIDQWYWRNKERGIWERARSLESNINGIKWIHTIKKNIGKGVNLEEENPLTKEDFDIFVKKCYDIESESKYISKERWIYPCDQNPDLYWEVDRFDSGNHIVIAEIEIPRKRYKVIIPDYINDKLLMEVTGLKQFSNRNLSNKLK